VFLYNKAHLRQNVAIPVPEATHLPRADGMLADLVNIIVWGVGNHVQNLLGCYGCLLSSKAEPLFSFLSMKFAALPAQLWLILHLTTAARWLL